VTTGRLFAGAFRAVFRARERAAQRQMLAALDDRMLKDLGLSRADVQRECSKPFWSR
jgi:uncharacterized protein YjiS (DUF1127 family)